MALELVEEEPLLLVAFVLGRPVPSHHRPPSWRQPSHCGREGQTEPGGPGGRPSPVPLFILRHRAGCLPELLIPQHLGDEALKPQGKRTLCNLQSKEQTSSGMDQPCPWRPWESLGCSVVALPPAAGGHRGIHSWVAETKEGSWLLAGSTDHLGLRSAHDQRHRDVHAGIFTHWDAKTSWFSRFLPCITLETARLSQTSLASSSFTYPLNKHLLGAYTA